LLGDRTGYAPEGSEPIAKLQLDRAAIRATADDEGFRRIIWAPRLFNDDLNPSSATERDPLAVVARFGRLLPTDKVDGGVLGRFVDFLLERISNVNSRAV
jgi:hypothetical protein